MAAVWVGWAPWAVWACKNANITSVCCVVVGLVYTKRTRRSPAPCIHLVLFGSWFVSATAPKTKAPSGAFVFGVAAVAQTTNSAKHKRGEGFVLALSFHIKLRL